MVKTFLLTIASTRLLLFLFWNSELMVNQKVDTWHHMYTGALLVLLSFILPRNGARLHLE